MSFKIKITETRQVKRTIGKKWEKIGEEEMVRNRQYVTSSDPDLTRMVDKMGYTPETETTVDEEREVLVQTLDTLDLQAVIKAINGL